MDALIFDFDGVVVDSEPIHLACFRAVLSRAGVDLRTEDYYSKYLGFDDHDCFVAALRDHGKPYTEPQIAQMVRDKTAMVKEAYGRAVQALPGVVELIRAAAAARVPLAVCSGALHEEIELAARTMGVLDCFGVVVAATDVHHGKPDPEGYRLTLDRLGRKTGRKLAAAACVVVEDSPAGIEAAKAAGMKVLAVTNSYAPDALMQANRIVASLADITLPDLRIFCDE